MALSPKTNVVRTVPAPIGGLNTRDAYSAMPETDAVRLTNWIPDAGGVRCRKGFKEWATNFTSDLPIQSVFAYSSPTSGFPSSTFVRNPSTVVGKLFAATIDGIFDISSTTDSPSIVQALGGTTYSGWMSTTMLTNTAGSYLLVVSEDDGYYHYNGTTWVKPTQGAGAGQVDNVDPADFCFVLVWKRRAWFIEKDTTKAWYLPTDSITGAAAAIDFGPLMKRGGHLSYLANWTIDAGEGIDDLLVAVSSNGDVMVYKGTDPASASTFELVGVWSTGQIPVGRRAFTQYGGDLVIASADGIVPISFITRGGAAQLVASSKEYSSKIRSSIGRALRNGFTERGWEMFLHPSERMLVVATNTETQQYAMNTTVNEWCQLEGVPISCHAASGGHSFVGTADSRVLIAFFGYTDEVPYGGSAGDGAPIYGIVQPAYTAFDFPALNKLFHMARPMFLGAFPPSIIVDMGTNYQQIGTVKYPALGSSLSSLWGTATFGTAVWASTLGRSFSQWYGAAGIGVAGSVIIYTTSVGDTLLTAVDYLYDVGGIM